jgi:glutaredoxin
LADRHPFVLVFDQSAMQLCCSYAKSDAKSYMHEYLDIFRGQQFDAERVDEFVGVVNDGVAVTMFVKKSCTYCTSATAMLNGELERSQFTFSSIDGATDDAAKDALKAMMGDPNLTFPVIFIRGRYIGGSQQLKEIINQQRFAALLSEPQSTFTKGAGVASRPNYLAQADGGTWHTFQLKGYGNVIRGYAFLQVVLFSVIIGLVANDLFSAAGVIAIVLLADLLAFTITGPTPLSPMCGLVTFLLWERRGPPVTLVPYKVVFMIYIAGLIRQLLCDEKTDSCWNTGAYVSLLINSALLAVFRL